MNSINIKRIERIEEAATEAARFIQRADDAIAALKRQDRYVMGCPETAAAKRASMDLTRSLAVMRRNPYT